MRETNPFDHELDAALATYADPADESALTLRILARIAAESPSAEGGGAFNPRILPPESTRALAPEGLASPISPSRRWLPWAIALPAAACLLFLFLSAPKSPHPSPRTAEQSHPSQPPSTLTGHTGPQPAPPPQSTQRPTSHPQAAQPLPAAFAANAAPLPKLAVFPTPHPLTPEEQALAVVAAQTPTPELQALANAQTQPGQLLNIATVHIPPLEPPNQGQN